MKQFWYHSKVPTHGASGTLEVEGGRRQRRKRRKEKQNCYGL